jgi:transposase
MDDGRRLVIAHSPEIAKRARRTRAERLIKVLRAGWKIAEKLEQQDEGRAFRGRRLSDTGAKIRFSEIISTHRLNRFLKIDVDKDAFLWDLDVKELKRELDLDGKLILISNVKDLSPEELVARYKDLADIERGFRVLKSHIEIAPVHHRLPNRIRAHTFICFLALVIQRTMRHRLRNNGFPMSPEELLYRLRAIRRHEVQLNTGKRLTGITTIQPEQRELVEAIGVPRPTGNAVQDAV